MGKFEKILLGSLLVLSASAIGVGLGNLYRHCSKKDERETLYKRTSIIADINKDGETSEDEWSYVFKEINRTYRSGRERELNKEDLRNYLNKHEEDCFLLDVATTVATSLTAD